MEFKNIKDTYLSSKLLKVLLFSFTSIFSLFVFSIFFYFISSNRIYSQTIEEIKKEVTTIESIPLREKAEMNIEVTKINSEKMKGKIDLEEKTIILDFKEINERIRKDRRKNSSENYQLLFIDDLNYFSNSSAEKMRRNIWKESEERYPYQIEEESERVKISYSEEPKTLYMIVTDKNSEELVKVFNISEFQLENGVETYATVNGTITTGTTSQNYMKYTYDNANCVLQDFGGTSASTLKSCTEVRVYQDGTTANASFPAMAVGGSWTNTNNTLSSSTSITLPTYSFTNGTNSVPTTIFLSSPAYTSGSNRYKRFLASSSPERGKVYGNYGSQVAEGVTAKLNMEISAEDLKTVRKISGENVTLTNSATSGSNQLTFIHARLETVGTSNNYYVPRRVNSTSTSATNISSYSASAKYPNITVEKVIMENNIVLNFKSGYAENTAINFNEAGTTSYVANQLEVVKTGDQPNYFMTGLASEGTVEFRRDGFTTGVILGTKSVSTTGVITATSLALTGKNGSKANLSLNYRAGGLATVRVVNWIGEDEYDLYIVHKEVSGLTRRKHKVTIKTPAYYATTGGNIGANNNFTFFQSFRSLEIQDFMDETPTLINEVGNILGRQNTSMYPIISFPIIAVGGSWTRSATSAVLTGVSALSVNFSKDSNSEKIPVVIYLKDAKSTATETSGLVTYKHVISGNGTASEKGRVYGTYYNSSTSEQITANLIMEFPSDILTKIRKINSADFTLNGEGDDQITYAISEYKNNSTYTIPIANNSTYVTKRDYPSIHVEKEIVANNITIEFHKEYTKGREVVFSSSGETTEAHITKIVTEGANSSHFNPNYFMTGTPFVGTINISGNLENSVAPITVDSEGKTGVITLSLLNERNQRASLKLQYVKDGTVKMSLDSWTGQGEFSIQIQHKEASTLIRRTYNVMIKTPRTFEFVSATTLDFGTIIKGFTGDTATATIIVKGLSSDGLVLVPDEENLDLVNGDSIITAGDFTIRSASNRNGEETYILTGVIVESLEATVSGEHTGTLQLNVEAVSTTRVNRNNR